MQTTEKKNTYFVDIDGTLVKSSGKYTKPYWGDTKGITKNIEFLIGKLATLSSGQRSIQLVPIYLLFVAGAT